MTIELKPSKNYPGRIDLSHRHSPESNMTTTIALTWEDLEELLHSAQQVLGKEPEPPVTINGDVVGHIESYDEKTGMVTFRLDDTTVQKLRLRQTNSFSIQEG